MSNGYLLSLRGIEYAPEELYLPSVVKHNIMILLSFAGVQNGDKGNSGGGERVASDRVERSERSEKRQRGDEAARSVAVRGDELRCLKAAE